jgi:hypothetical protein
MGAEPSARGNGAVERFVISAMVTERDNDALAGDVADQVNSSEPFGRKCQHDDFAPGGRLQAIVFRDARVTDAFPAMSAAWSVFGMNERAFQMDAGAHGPDQRDMLDRVGEY